MEDIEDARQGYPAAGRLPLAAVAVKPKSRSSRLAQTQTQTQPEAQIPGTPRETAAGVEARPMSVTRHLPRHHRLLATLALHGRLAAAATLFSTAVRTTHALNSLLAAVCSSQSFLRIAPKVLLAAVPSASPDAATFRILTSALCRARQPSAAADILRCMPSLLLDPDSSHCRAVLFSLCQCGAPASEAVAFLDDMRQWGVSPSRADHGAVLNALLREGMVAEAYGVVKKTMDADGVAPGLVEFGPILRAFSDMGEFDSVEEVFDEILLRGLVPDVAVYDVYVGALCRKGDLAGARRMAQCMERAGCPPDVTTFRTIIAGCVSAGDMDAAREVAQEATSRGLRAVGFTGEATSCRS